MQDGSRLSTERRSSERRQYTQDNLQRALDAVKNKKVPMRQAAKCFGIPRSTLQDKIRGRTSEAPRLGRPSILSEEEEKLIVQWVINSNNAGFTVSKKQLLDSVTILIKDLKRKNTFTNGIPGEKWFSLFLNRHPTIAQFVAQRIKTPSTNISEDDIRNWFKVVSEYLEFKGLIDVLSDYRRVYSADERGFFLMPEGKTVLAKKGVKAVDSDAGNDGKECVTVLVNANAAGQLAPTNVVYSNERIPKTIAQSFPQDWAISKSKTGWMTAVNFYEYITNIFHPWLVNQKIEFPVILFIDGHSSYLSFGLYEFCSKNTIELVALYPNSKHLLQPMDAAVFKPLEIAWKDGVDRWMFENNGRKMRKDEFAPILKTVMDSSLDISTIQDGFQTAGLSDLEIERVHVKIVPEETSDLISTSFLESKVTEMTNHLAYIETKIGQEKLDSFSSGDVLPQDEGLYDLWNTIKADVELHSHLLELKMSGIANPVTNCVL